MELKLLSVKNKKEIADMIKTAFAIEPWNDRWDNPEVLNLYIADIAENANSLILGMFDGGELVGMTLGRLKHWFCGTEYCIDDLCVKPSRQGMGDGSELVRLVKEYARENNIAKISLKTRKTAPAYRFYKKNGFTEMTDDVFFEYDVLNA